MDKDFDARYKVLGSRDRRFDGQFFVAVTSTGIYCRPSCPAAVPKRHNVRFFPTAAATSRGRLPRLPALPSLRRARIAGLEPAR